MNQSNFGPALNEPVKFWPSQNLEKLAQPKFGWANFGCWPSFGLFPNTIFFTLEKKAPIIPIIPNIRPRIPIIHFFIFWKISSDKSNYSKYSAEDSDYSFFFYF